MKRIVLNYYLLAVLFLVAQAIFVVAQGNSSITQIKIISDNEKANEKLAQQITILESDLAHLESIENTRITADLEEYENISARQSVSSKSLASNMP